MGGAIENVATGKCLTLERGWKGKVQSPNNGVKVVARKCKNSSPVWSFSEASGPLVYRETNFCLDAGDLEVGFELMLWECNGNAQQMWEFDESSGALSVD